MTPEYIIMTSDYQSAADAGIVTKVVDFIKGRNV